MLLQVRDMLDEYKQLQKQGRDSAADRWNGTSRASERRRPRPKSSRSSHEIKAELNITTLDRLADYLRLADDKSLPDEQKVALAVSGWLLGSGSGTENLAVAASLWQVRDAGPPLLEQRPRPRTGGRFCRNCRAWKAARRPTWPS